MICFVKILGLFLNSPLLGAFRVCLDHNDTFNRHERKETDNSIIAYPEVGSNCSGIFIKEAAIN